MADTIVAGKKRTLTLAVKNGKPLSGDPVWTASSSGIVGLLPNTGGMSCDVTNIAPGTVTVTASALSAAGKVLTASVDITCLEGEADAIEITVGPEVDL